jgi:RimJ/RimL family protein N-acetyltransferase
LPATNDSENDNVAGIVSLSGCNTEHLLAEMGIVTFKPFQRTHVSSHAVGLMRYALDLPDQGGLGLRRLQWQTNQANKASVGLALKMGFVQEAVLRWHRVLAPGKEMGHNGGRERKGDPREGCAARDTVMLAVCWDDWEDGVREKVESMLSANASTRERETAKPEYHP